MPGIAGVVSHAPIKSHRLIADLASPIMGAQGFRSFEFEHFQAASGTAVHTAQNARETVWVALSGRIDNLEELERELLTQGYPPPSQQPADILLQAFTAWGATFAQHLRGEYVIAVLDKRHRRLYLIRDRLGRKPLYWCETQSHFLFSTHLKSLLHTGLVPQTCARDGVAAYLFFSCCPQDFTLIKGVNKLLPGYQLIYHLDRSHSIHNYWSYSSHFTGNLPLGTEELATKVDEGIQQKLDRCLEGKSRVGCLLDGSLGSLLLAAQVGRRQDLPKTLYTSSVQVDLPEISPAIDYLKKTFQFDHYHVEGSLQSSIQELPRLIWHLDEPVTSFSALALWEVLGIARQDKCTLLSSAGCPELFGGSPRYLPRPVHWSPAQLLAHLPKSWLRLFLIPLIRLFSSSFAYEILRRSQYNPLQGNYVRQQALFSEREIRLLHPTLSRCFDADVFLHKFHHLHLLRDIPSALMYFDVKTYLPDKWLFLYERLTTPFNVNWEAPFLSMELAELLAESPSQAKFDRNQQPLLLMKLLKKSAPDLPLVQLSPRTRLLSQFRQALEKLPPILESLKDAWLIEVGILSKKGLRQLQYEALSSDHGLEKAWAVLTLEVWFRLFVGRPIQDQPLDRDLITCLKERR